MGTEIGEKLIVGGINRFEREIYTKFCKYKNRENKHNKVRDIAEDAEWILGKKGKYEDFFDGWSTEYKYVCIDEANELTDYQWNLLYEMGRKSKWLVATIFPEMLGYFKKQIQPKLGNIKIVKLEINHRTNGLLAKKAGRMLYAEVSGEMNDDDGKPVLAAINVGRKDEQLKYLAENVWDVQGRTAILYEDISDILVLIDCMLSNGLDFEFVGDIGEVFVNAGFVRKVASAVKIENAKDLVTEVIKRSRSNLNRDVKHAWYNLAKVVNDVDRFIQRIGNLDEFLRVSRNTQGDRKFTIGDVDAVKGAEFDNVYLLDSSSDDSELSDDERRNFYIGLTRAKSRLTVFSIGGKKNQYLRLLGMDSSKFIFYEGESENLDMSLNYEERLITCKVCGKKDVSDNFGSYGGVDTPNEGVCYECEEKINAKNFRGNLIRVDEK